SSGISRNAKKIIYESDGVIEDLEDYPDYRIIDERDQYAVVDKVKSIVSYHLGKGTADGFKPVNNLGQDLHPDDIQVITPVNKHIWGTVSLNGILQDIFNPKHPYDLSVKVSRGGQDKVEFRKNDRVMHIKSNQKDRVRLIHKGE